MLSVFFVSEIRFLKCVFQVRCGASSVMPRYLNCFTGSMRTPSSFRLVIYFIFEEKHIAFVFCGFMVNFVALHHSEKRSIASCMRTRASSCVSAVIEKAISSANSFDRIGVIFGKVLKRIIKRMGLSMEPCGTPLFMFRISEYVFSRMTWIFLFVRKSVSQDSILPPMFFCARVLSSIMWSTESKADFKSKNTTTVVFLVTRLFLISCSRAMIGSMVLRLILKPDWV